MQENTVERLLLEKNEQGMDALLLHYGPLMRYIIAPILQNPQDREDCLSEVSMRVWEKIGQFDGEKGSFHAWLTAITRNTALNHARRASGSSAAPVWRFSSPVSASWRALSSSSSSRRLRRSISVTVR